MTSKLTREQLHERARENVKALKMASRQTAFESAREEILADLQLAELALAAMDSEPVAWTWHYREQWHVTSDKGRAAFVATDGDVAVLPLYRHAQPVPVVSTDLLHAAASAIEDLLTTKDRAGAGVWFDLPFRLRSAANAQPAPAAPVCTCPSGDGSLRWPCPVHPGNSPVIPDGWTGNDKANAALMMLDRIETVDPVDDDRIDGIKRIVRELAAAPHDTPALNSVQSVDSVADRWIPVSERMPPSRHEVLVGRWWGEKPRWCCKWATYIPGHPDSQSSGWLIPGASWTPTHWMPLPAAPQEPSLACISKRSQHLS